MSSVAGAEAVGERKAKLYGIRGSAPSFSPELMLRHKGIPYRRVNLIPDRHRKTLPAKGFPGRTVPALIVAGRRAQTNGAIARLLDEIVPLVAALLGVADVAADLGARPVASLAARLMPAQPLRSSGLRRPSPRPLPPRPQPLTTPRSRRFSPK